MTFSLVYNSYTITEAMQVGKFSYIEGYDSAQISVDFVLEAASASALTTLDIAAAAALTEWDKDCTFTYGGTHRSYSQSANSGFLARPKLSKPGGEADTETSRRYRWSVEIKLPADASGDDGRQSGEWHIIYEPSRRRRVILSAVYTATSGPTSAYSNASTNGPTWADGVITSLGGTYDAITPGEFTVDHRNKICRYSRVYREQVEKDYATGQYAGVIDSKLSYSQTWPARFGASPYPPQLVGETPPCVVTATYEATLDTTIISTADTAETLYRTVLRPWLITELSTVLNRAAHPEAAGSLLAYDPGESFQFSRSTCEMVGRITLLAARSSTARTFYSETIDISGDCGVTSEKLWSGAHHTYSRWGVGQSQVATQTVTIKQLGVMPAEPEGLAAPWQPEGPFREVASSETLGSASNQIGGAALDALFEYSKTWVRTYRYVASSDDPVQDNYSGGIGAGGAVAPAANGGQLVRVGGDGNIQILAIAGAK